MLKNRWRVMGVFWAALLPALRAEIVAQWMFDEQGGGRVVLKDAGPSGLHVALGTGGALVPGKFGSALRPRLTGAVDGPVGLGVFTSPLDLGGRDWTIECWLKLDTMATGEGVIFEVGRAPPDRGGMQTRFSVLPNEDAFILSGLVMGPGVDGTRAEKTVELPNPDGPPPIFATMRATTLTLGKTARLPRGEWFHVALIYHAAREELRLFLDGKVRAVALAVVGPPPLAPGGYVCFGSGADGNDVLAGAIDELRVSRQRCYTGDFTPPGSFGR